MVLRSQILVHKLALPSAEQALPGRNEPLPVADVHHLNGHPIKPPFPAGLQQAVFGLGCFWGPSDASGSSRACTARRWAMPAA